MMQRIIDILYSIPSAIIHTLVFIAWFIFHWNINLLTNVVSLEAIYLAIFIGVTQRDHHDKLTKLTKGKK